MSDNRTYLQRAQDLAKQRTGEEVSDADLVANFSLNGNERRSQILDQCEQDERAAGEIGSDVQSLKEAGRRKNTIAAMRAAHSRLRAIGR
jgi:hypothetical protein